MQRLRGAWSPAHTHVAEAVAAPDSIQLQAPPGSPLKDDSTNKKTQEAN